VLIEDDQQQQQQQQHRYHSHHITVTSSHAGQSYMSATAVNHLSDIKMIVAQPRSSHDQTIDKSL